MVMCVLHGGPLDGESFATSGSQYLDLPVIAEPTPAPDMGGPPPPEGVEVRTAIYRRTGRTDQQGRVVYLFHPVASIGGGGHVGEDDSSRRFVSGEELNRSRAADALGPVLDALRFSYSLDFRRPAPPGWAGPYRVQVSTNKNEREGFRGTFFGQTALEAARAALAHQRGVDARYAEMSKVRVAGDDSGTGRAGGKVSGL